MVIAAAGALITVASQVKLAHLLLLGGSARMAVLAHVSL